RTASRLVVSRVKRMASLLVLFSATAAAADDDPIKDKVTRMAGIGFSSAPSFSPDGTSIAFLSNITGVPQIFTVPTDGGWPIQVTTGSDPAGPPQWSPKGDVIAFSRAPGGGLNTQVYVVAADGTGECRLTAGGKDNNDVGTWNADGCGP